MHKRERQAAGSSLIEHTDSDETKLCEVAKHPIGLITIYVGTFVGILAGLVLSFVMIPSVVEDTDTAFGVALLFALVMIALGIVVMVLTTSVYRRNRLIVTDRNITQILQYSLFSRKVSQLNLVNVEDVTAVQNGFLPTLFSYGELNIETAGEQSNFKFIYCPRPGYYAKIILNAREKILGQHDGDPRVDIGPGTTR